MTWFKIDDAWWRGPKIRKLGTEPVTVPTRVAGAGLWALAGSWAVDNGGGFVPWCVIEEWDPGRMIARHLIAVGAWREIRYEGEDGVAFLDPLYPGDCPF